MESQQGSLPSYYSILGVSIDSSADDIRRAYRKLAMQWHPDRWTRTPSLLGEAKQKFQQIQEAYSVLSDQRKRTLYDVGLYDPDEEEDEGYCDFLEEMMSLMAQNKDKKYSMDELQTMFVEMTQGFEFSWWPCGPSVVRDSGYSESMQRGFGFADGEKSRRAEMADVWSRQLLQIGDEALSMWTIHHDTRPPIHPSLMTSDSSFWVPRFGN